MGKVSESIFSGATVIIPMADVQHIERHWYGSNKATKDNYRGIKIITKHTHWDMQADTWSNNIYLDRKEADKFIQAWCTYRHELECDTLLRPPKSENIESVDNTQHSQLAIAMMNKLVDILSKNHTQGQIYEVAKVVNEWRSATAKRG